MLAPIGSTKPASPSRRCCDQSLCIVRAKPHRRHLHPGPSFEMIPCLGRCSNAQRLSPYYQCICGCPCDGGYERARSREWSGTDLKCAGSVRLPATRNLTILTSSVLHNRPAPRYQNPARRSPPVSTQRISRSSYLLCRMNIGSAVSAVSRCSLCREVRAERSDRERTDASLQATMEQFAQEALSKSLGVQQDIFSKGVGLTAKAARHPGSSPPLDCASESSSLPDSAISELRTA